MEDTNENEGNKKIVEDFYGVLPDLYRMARVAYNIQSQELMAQEAGIHNVMLKTKNFVISTASATNTVDLVKDIVQDPIIECPECPDSPANDINVGLEKEQGI